jgi:hypothetical protein
MTETSSVSSPRAYDAELTTTSGAARNELLTIVAIAVVAYACSTVVHEALGHGGACVIVGCKPQLVTSMQFQGDESRISLNAQRFVAAGGSIANAAAAALALVLMRVIARRHEIRSMWFFCWLLATINLLQPAGYLLYSGVAGIGDWADVARSFSPVWLWRVLLAVVGAVAYFSIARWSMRLLGHHLEIDVDERVDDATRYALTSYVTGGMLSVLAGLRDPGGTMLIVVSGAAASFGGTSALAWGPQLLRNPSFATRRDEELVIVPRWRWMLLAGVMAIGFIFGLGGGLRLGA